MIAFTMIMAYFYDHGKRTSDLKNTMAIKSIYFFMCLPAVIVSSVRYDVGTDQLMVYQNSFNAVLRGDIITRNSSVEIERGLIVLFRFLQMFSKKPLIFFVFSSVVIYPLLFRYIREYHSSVYGNVHCLIGHPIFIQT